MKLKSKVKGKYKVELTKKEYDNLNKLLNYLNRKKEKLKKEEADIKAFTDENERYTYDDEYGSLHTIWRNKKTKEHMPGNYSLLSFTRHTSLPDFEL